MFRYILVDLLIITNSVVWSWALEKQPVHEIQPVNMEFV